MKYSIKLTNHQVEVYLKNQGLDLSIDYHVNLYAIVNIIKMKQ